MSLEATLAQVNAQRNRLISALRAAMRAHGAEALLDKLLRLDEELLAAASRQAELDSGRDLRYRARVAEALRAVQARLNGDECVVRALRAQENCND